MATVVKIPGKTLLVGFGVGDICGGLDLWLANGYAGADFVGDRAAKVRYVSLSERTWWQ